jgi:hypothetical protein
MAISLHQEDSRAVQFCYNPAIIAYRITHLGQVN